MAELNEFHRLEQALIDAGRAIDYPPTPNLAARVRANLNGELRCDRPRQPDRPAWHWPPAFVVALAILAAIALLLIIPETREAIAQLLGLRTIRIIERTPTPHAAGGLAGTHIHAGCRALQAMLRIDPGRSAAARRFQTAAAE